MHHNLEPKSIDVYVLGFAQNEARVPIVPVEENTLHAREMRIPIRRANFSVILRTCKTSYLQNIA